MGEPAIDPVPGPDFNSGYQFAVELFDLVHKYGPPELDCAAKEALAQHLVASAVEWVKASNRAAIAKATAP